uniref:Uncharacterized protein n=1 Tax=Physcomitrium patens TaxID=3218 RepID=A0A2K1IJC5_PHYPA|nr:hypothetical protein PHYPA_028070 [Physcomitrium patens]
MGCYGLLVDYLAKPCLFNVRSCSCPCQSSRTLLQRLTSLAENLTTREIMQQGLNVSKQAA